MGDQTPEPPMITQPDRPKAAERVALGLMIFGVLTLAQDIASIFFAIKSFRTYHTSISLTLPLGFLGLWFVAWLVWKDKRAVWPIMDYLAAAGLGSALGGALVGFAVVPSKLVHAYAVNESGWFGFYAAYLAGSMIFLLWILLEARQVAWPPGWHRPRSKWLRQPAVIVYSAVLCGVGVLLMWSLLTGPWTKPALERARRSLGNGYNYQILSYNFQSVNGHTTYHAVVLAYTDTQFDSIQLNWED